VTKEEQRVYPQAPRVGVGAVVLVGDRVLLVQRGRAPLAGSWSFPGGLLEVGETLAQCAAREVYEETGVRVEPVEMIATLDRILYDADGRVEFHYVLVDWLCRLAASHADELGALPELDPDSRPVLFAGDDAKDARWVRLDEIGTGGDYSMDKEAAAVLARAAGRLRSFNL